MDRAHKKMDRAHKKMDRAHTKKTDAKCRGLPDLTQCPYRYVMYEGLHTCEPFHGRTTDSRAARTCTRVPGSSAWRRRCPRCTCCGCAPARRLKRRPTPKGPPVQVQSHNHDRVTRCPHTEGSSCEGSCVGTQHPLLMLASVDRSGAVEPSMGSPESRNESRLRNVWLSCVVHAIKHLQVSGRQSLDPRPGVHLGPQETELHTSLYIHFPHATQ